MEASAQYREFAEKCDRLVEETKEPRHKQMLQEMAGGLEEFGRPRGA